LTRPYMPGYGISTSTDGLLPWSFAEERLTDAIRYWLSTVSPDGAPHTMPVWAVWHDAALWFSTGARSRKARNLRERPACSIHPDGEDVVVLNGTADFDADATAALAAYRAKYAETPPDPLIRIAPATVFALVEANFTTSPTRWRF
jgi:Pyridoxamine 5'-phosphate oxidase